MTREQLEHVLRATSQIAPERDVLVIGSQSLLGNFAEDRLPLEVSPQVIWDASPTTRNISISSGYDMA